MRVIPDIPFSSSAHHKYEYTVLAESITCDLVSYSEIIFVEARVTPVFTISGRAKVLHPPYVIAKLCVGDPKHEESMKGRIAMYFFIILII